MVIQKNTNEIDTNKNVVTLDAASSSTWSLQTPAKIINIRSTSNMQAVS